MPNIDLENKTILITGAAGFIGSFLCKKLLTSFKNIKIIGVDCISDYYDTSLKEERLKMLKEFGSQFIFEKKDIADKAELERIFVQYKPDLVVNLAAQTLSVFTISLNAAEITRLSIWSLPQVPVSTAATRRFLIQRKTR